MRTLGVIPARGGSKGIRRKNVRNLWGRPLIAYTISAAMASNLDEVVVSTEDDEIAVTANEVIALHQGNAYVLPRPTRLAQDDTLIEAVLLNVLHFADPFDVIVLLNPTAPLRMAMDINACLQLMERCNSVVSVTESPRFLWRNGKPLFDDRPRRQDMTPTFVENGAIYATKVDRFVSEGTLTGGATQLYEMPQERSVDIDTEFDFKVCELILNGQH